MRIIVVDDEKPILQMMQKRLQEVAPESEVTFFDRSTEALEYVKKNEVDVAFLDIRMPVIGGVELAKELKKINPLINVVFCTAYTEYMPAAIDLHASGYLLKPVTAEAVEKALQNLLHPVEKPMPKIFVRTFGNFDLFVDGVPVLFKSKKSKELLAFLVHKRGSVVNKKEIAAALFGDSYSATTQSYLKRIYKELLEVLTEHGIESILVKGFNQYAVETTKFSCDQYDFDRGDPQAINDYTGEYLSQYEWAQN